MEQRIEALFEARFSSDRGASYQALVELFAITEQPVNWAYDVWDRMLAELSHRDGARRSFAAQLLARLAISDPESRMIRDFQSVAAIMRDPKTVTARHALQSLWRIGLAGSDRAALVVDALAQRYEECIEAKNAGLVRTDVITALGHLAKSLDSSGIEGRVMALIDSETDPKERRKQWAAWAKASGK